jgi:choline dehydrogenase
MDEFDFVIVGAGTAGSVLASRLTEDPGVRVLVLEAGGSWIPENVDAAPLWFTLLGSAVDWDYRSVPQPGLGGRVTHEPRGKMPGGTSNLYIMMHVRGHPSDFDNWAYQGAAGWSYADLLPYFKRLESQEDPSGLRSGTNGPQPVTNAGLHMPNPMSRVFIDSCVELGYPETTDFNGPQMFGVGWHHLDVVDGQRRGALRSFLEPALGRPNLTLRTNAQATRLVIEGNRCTGVTYLQGQPTDPAGPGRTVGAGETERAEPGIHTVRAAGEVIVACGAIESPKLLLLSGIGDPEQLRLYDIPVLADVPGVGANFHNHVLTGVIAEAIEPVSAGQQNLSESALFTASQPGMVAPDLQLAFVHVPFDPAIGTRHPDSVSILPGVVRPQSRGWVALASADPLAAPLVNPNYLGDDADTARLVQAVRLAREIFAAPTFSGHVKGELMPGPEVRTDAELTEFVRAHADSYHHQAGSCRMGIDNQSVVDPGLRVHGVAGLRVVDASVMPAVPSGNCHTAIAAIAERAADLIREEPS